MIGSEPTGTRRTRVLLFAVIGSYVSKAGSFVMTLIALPLAVRALSDEEFARLAGYWLVMAWTGFFNPMIGPALGVAIASSLARTDGPSEARSIARAAVGPGMGAALIVSVPAAVVAGLMLDLSAPSAVATVICISMLTHFTAIGDGFRVGFHRAHLNGVWAGVGALVGFAAVALAVVLDGPAIAFAIGIFLLPLAVRAAAFGLEYYQTRVDAGSPVAVSWLELARRNAYHIATVQLGSVLGFPLAMFLVIRLQPDVAGALFVTQSVGLAALGLVAGAFEPLGATAADAVGRNDLAWLRRTARVLRYGCLAVSVAGVFLAVTLGRPVATALYDAVAPNRWTLVLIAASVGLLAAFGFSYQILLGMGEAPEAARAVLPGYALGAVVSAWGALIGNVPLIVSGAMLVPSAVGLVRLDVRLRGLMA